MQVHGNHRAKRATGLPDKEGRVREKANKGERIQSQGVRNRLTLCVYAIWQGPVLSTWPSMSEAATSGNVAIALTHTNACERQ
jgi:hypothetical protein